MPRSPFRLRSTIGRSYSVEPEDVLRTKRLLKDLGYFEPPEFGMTSYPDEPLFKGIEQFQDDFDLYRDGVMNPDGETTVKLNEVLDYRDRTSTPRRQKTAKANSPQASPHQPGRNRDRPGQQPEKRAEEEKIALAPAIPVIVYEIAAAFSMTLAAAYAWWLSLSADEKKKVREHINNIQEHGTLENAHEDECERLLQIDLDTCRAISKRRGKQAAQRCFASAHQRNAACRRGRSVDELHLWIHGTTSTHYQD